MPKEQKEKPQRKWPAKHTEEYHDKRSQNNVAVKKSREKAKEKGTQTKERVDDLKVENTQLEHKVQTLKKELSVLKDLFTSHASGAAPPPATSNNVPESIPPQDADPVLLDHVYSNTTTTASTLT